MSAGPNKPKNQPRRRRRTGSDKNTRQGFSRIPDPAWPIILEVLEEQGLSALYDLCSAARFDVAEVVRLTPAGHRRWKLGDEEFELPRATSERLETLNAILADHEDDPGGPAGYLTTALKRVTTEVKRRLAEAGYTWAPNVKVTVGTLHQASDEFAEARWRDQPHLLASFRRNPSVRPEGVRPATNITSAAAFDHAFAKIIAEVDPLLSDRARQALEELREEGQ
jgi:hypothetical protein